MKLSAGVVTALLLYRETALTYPADYCRFESGEVFAETSVAVKESYLDKVNIVCSNMSGSGAGYVPVSEAYDTRGYEVQVSPYSKAAEAVLRQGFIKLADQLD